MSKNLIRSLDVPQGSGRINGLMDVWRFQWGHSVFCNLHPWIDGDMVKQFNQRNETMGIVPFPRPDNMAPGDPRYRQLNDARDCYGVPRGISREKAELAVKAFREYTVSYYKKMANSSRALDYLQSDESARATAIKMFIDITNEDYGDNLLAVWKYLGSNENIQVNEYVKNIGIWDLWSSDILGDSLYRVKGASQYAVQVEAKMGQVNEIMNTIAMALNSSDFYDNIPPRFSDIEGIEMIFTVGTDSAGIDWGKYLSINDNVDGTIAVSKASADLLAVNFNKPGRYNNAAVFSVRDSSGNEGTAVKTVTVYDGTNKTPPVLKIKAEYRTVKLNEKTDDINWKKDFVESAADRDGLDIINSLFADLSEIDTTKPGKYNVTLTVKDYAGNEASADVSVTVE